jgi:CO dehydrogenase nickel-insertion accessory protein CooC1
MPQQLFGDVDAERRIVICDMEAGVGSIVRKGEGDTVIVVAEPSVKSIDVAWRAAGAAVAKGAQVIVVANRVRDEADEQAIGSKFEGFELVVVPEDPAIAEADEQGRAPIDVDPESPGVRALGRLAERLGAQPVGA